MEETVRITTFRTSPLSGTDTYERRTATQEDTRFPQPASGSNLSVCGIVADGRNQDTLCRETTASCVESRLPNAVKNCKVIFILGKESLCHLGAPLLVELTPERIFSINPKIRWAGLATDQGEVLFVTMRSGLKSLSPEETDRSFMQLGPMLLSGVCERLAPWAGPLQAVVSRYEKVAMIVTKIERFYLAVTINSEDADSIREIMEGLRRLRL